MQLPLRFYLAHLVLYVLKILPKSWQCFEQLRSSVCYKTNCFIDKLIFKLLKLSKNNVLLYFEA